MVPFMPPPQLMDRSYPRLVWPFAQHALHHAAPQEYIARTSRMPAKVNANEPRRWLAIVIVPHRYSLRMSSVTISAENVENVVSPPRNPVVTSKRNSGVNTACRVRSSIAKPISKPPRRLALSVPSGTVGNSGLRRMPSPQRNQAPIAAPPPTARIPPQGIQNPPFAQEKRADQSGNRATWRLTERSPTAPPRNGCYV